MELEDIHGDAVETSRAVWLRIKRNDPILVGLKVSFARDRPLFGPIITDAKIGELGRAIGKHTHLVHLVLNAKVSSTNFDDVRRIFQLLCEGLNQNQSIKKISLSGDNNFCGEMCQFLNPFFQNNSNVHFILLNGGLNLEGTRWLVAPLMARRSCLKTLVLQDNGIDDILVEQFVTAMLVGNSGLAPKEMFLCNNNIGQYGCNLIARLLEDPNCMMEVLTLVGNRNVNNNAAIRFANALTKNKTLKRLFLNGTSINKTGWNSFSSTLCNKTSVNETYSSNHTVQSLGWFDPGNNPLPSDLKQYLELNHEDTETAALRKVLMHHFTREFSMDPFKKMKLPLLVNILKLIDRVIVENKEERYVIPRFTIIFELVLNHASFCRKENIIPAEGGSLVSGIYIPTWTKR